MSLQQHLGLQESPFLRPPRVFLASQALLPVSSTQCGCCVLQVAKASDVLFVFGGLAVVRDTIKEIKDDLTTQIVVPVTTDGNLDVFLVGFQLLAALLITCILLDSIALPSRMPPVSACVLFHPKLAAHLTLQPFTEQNSRAFIRRCCKHTGMHAHLDLLIPKTSD